MIKKLLAGAVAVTAMLLAPAVAFADHTASISPTSIAAGSSATVTLSISYVQFNAPMNLLKIQPQSCFMLTGSTDSKLSLNSGFGGNTATLGGAWWFNVSPAQVTATTATYTFQVTTDSTTGSCLFNATTYGGSSPTGQGSITTQTLTVSAAATPTPTPTPIATPTPAPSPATGANTAMDEFISLFEAIMIKLAAIVVPVFVLSWVLRLVSEMLTKR